MKPDIGSESRFLPTPPAFDAAVSGGWGSRWNIAMPFGMKKTRMAWLPNGEKNFEDIFIRFDRMYESDAVTDGRTDGHRTTANAALA